MKMYRKGVEIPLSYLYNRKKLIEFINKNESFRLQDIGNGEIDIIAISDIIDNQSFGGDGILMIAELSDTIRIQYTNEDDISLNCKTSSSGVIRRIPSFVVPSQVDLRFNHSITEVDKMFIYKEDEDTPKEEFVIQQIGNIRRLLYYDITTIRHKFQVVKEASPDKIRKISL